MEKMLIPINYDMEQPTVSARDLHSGLAINTRFNDWFSRMTEYGFESGKDFYSKMSKTSETGGRPAVDYQISVDMAKQICMIQRSEKGKQYRQYFIDLEKAWNTPEQVMARALKLADKTIDTLKEDNKKLMGIFEPVLTMINAYNKAISEKANDVDYFADAYLKVLGSKLEEDDVAHIRDDRIINFDGDTERLIVEFLQKPDGDTTQEHLIDRLEKLIFHISMVANISDENFGTSSGIAMKYKLQAMSNLEKTKERKFTSGMNRRYRLIFSNPVSGMKKDDWVKIHPHFTPNFPANLQEEAEIAKNLEGVVSQETQLGVLSIVDNVQDEIKKIDTDQNKVRADPVMKQMFGGGGQDDE